MMKSTALAVTLRKKPFENVRLLPYPYSITPKIQWLYISNNYFLRAPLGPGPPPWQDQAHPLSGNRYCWMPISDPLDSWPLATLTISISHTCCLHPWVSDILGSSTPLGLQCSVLSFPSLPVPVYAQGSHLLLPEGGQVTRWDSGLPIHGSVSRM